MGKLWLILLWFGLLFLAIVRGAVECLPCSLMDWIFAMWKYEGFASRAPVVFKSSHTFVLWPQTTKRMSFKPCLFQIYGFPLNVPYSTPDGFVQAVVDIGAHKIDSHDVELSLAINVTPYPHSIVSVWIYFAVLIKNMWTTGILRKTFFSPKAHLAVERVPQNSSQWQTTYIHSLLLSITSPILVSAEFWIPLAHFFVRFYNLSKFFHRQQIWSLQLAYLRFFQYYSNKLWVAFGKKQPAKIWVFN